MKHYMECQNVGQVEDRVGSVTKPFNFSSVTDEHKDMHTWLDFILEENIHLSSVENVNYRKFTKAKHIFSYQRMKDVSKYIVQGVEERIALEMKKAGRGAVMYDGWSMAGIHYIGVFACYCREVVLIENGIKTKKSIPEITLISCQPMHDVVEENIGSNSSETELASAFNANLHFNHFKHVFKTYYDIDVQTWAKCAIADNTSTNKKVARLLGIPHVPCSNHLLNLDMKEWIAEDPIQGMLDEITNVMKQARTLKNAAVLSTHTHLKPILPNVTRWSSVKETVQRYVKIYDELSRTSNHHNSDLVMDNRMNFKYKVERHSKYFNEIDLVTKALQERKLPLQDSRLLLDELVNGIQGTWNTPGSVFHNCSFRAKRIKLAHTQLHPNAHFESGVVKIQGGNTETLTDEEKRACRSLKIEPRNELEGDSDTNDGDGSGSDDDDGNHGGPGSVLRRVKRKKSHRLHRMMQGHQTEYGDCNFIYGSVAEVERLWSIAKHILTNERKGMMEAASFEELIFLKLNRSFWDLQDVARADIRRQQQNDVVEVNSSSEAEEEDQYLESSDENDNN